MKNSLFLIGALVLGFVIGKQKTPAPIKCEPQETVAEAPAPPVPSPPRQKKMEEKPVIRFRPVPSEPSVIPPAPSAAQTVPRPQRNPQFITLTSSLISKMEQDWHDLPQQIELTRNQSGWKITHLQNNSLFAQAGLREGDLITDKAVDELRDQDANTAQDLPERFSRILNYVSR